MLSADDWALVEKILTSSLAEVFGQTQREKTELAAQANLKGVFNSGMFTLGIAQIDEKAKDVRGDKVYLAIEQVVRAKREGVSKEEANAIKNKLGELIVRANGGVAYQSAEIVKKYESKLDVLFLDINSSIAANKSNMTFNAPVGVVVSHGGTATNFEVAINGRRVKILFRPQIKLKPLRFHHFAHGDSSSIDALSENAV